jgi:hypothetical protein
MREVGKSSARCRLRRGVRGLRFGVAAAVCIAIVVLGRSATVLQQVAHPPSFASAARAGVAEARGAKEPGATDAPSPRGGGGGLHAHECGAAYLARQHNVSVVAVTPSAPLRAIVGRAVELQLRNVGRGAINASALHFHVRAVGASLVVGAVVPWCTGVAATDGACWTATLTVHDAGEYELEVTPVWLNGALFGATSECTIMPGHEYVGTPVDFWLHNRTGKLNSWLSCCDWCELHPQCAYWVVGRKVLAKLVDAKREAIKWGSCTLLQNVQKIRGIERSRYDAALFVSGTRRRGTRRQHYIGGLSYGTHNESAESAPCRARARIAGSPFALTCADAPRAAKGQGAGAGAGAAGGAGSAPPSRAVLSARHRALPLCAIDALATPGRWLPLIAAPHEGEAREDGGEAWWVERLNARSALRAGHHALHGAPPPLAALRLPPLAATAFAWAPLRCRLRFFDAARAKRCVEEGSVGWAAWRAGPRFARAPPADPPPRFDAVVLEEPFTRAEWRRTFARFDGVGANASMIALGDLSAAVRAAAAAAAATDAEEGRGDADATARLNSTTPRRLRALIVLDGFARVMEGGERSVGEFERTTAALLRGLRNLTEALHPTSRLIYVGGCVPARFARVPLHVPRTFRALRSVHEFLTHAPAALSPISSFLISIRALPWCSRWIRRAPSARNAALDALIRTGSQSTSSRGARTARCRVL